MHACMHAYMQICIHAYMHTCMHECTCILANMWTRIHAYLTRYATFHQSTATSHAKRVRLYVCMYVCGGEHVHGAQKKWAAGSGKRWLGRKTRRQDFCRRLMEKILHHQMHLKSRPSCSPFNIGFKKKSPKQRSWMTEILHRRTKLQNTTLKRGCGGTSYSVLSNMPAPVQDFFHQQYDYAC